MSTHLKKNRHAIACLFFLVVLCTNCLVLGANVSRATISVRGSFIRSRNHRAPNPGRCSSSEHSGGRIPGGASKKSIAIAMDFFICVRRTQHHLRACTQHHLTKGQHHSAARRTQMNEVALRANGVLRNDVMLRINDVALRANGISPSGLEKHRKL